MHPVVSAVLMAVAFPLTNAVVAAVAALTLFSRTVFDVAFAPTHWFSQFVAARLISDDAYTVFALEGFFFTLGVGAIIIFILYQPRPK